MSRLATALCAASVLSCVPQRPAVPTAATATKGLTVCWYSREEREALGVQETTKWDSGTASMIDALESRFKGAGYVLVMSGCDISIAWTTKQLVPVTNLGDMVTTMVVRGKGNVLVDSFRFEFFRYDVPLHDPDRLAIWMVNAINDSPKVAELGQAKTAPAQKPAALLDPAAQAAANKAFDLHRAACERSAKDCGLLGLDYELGRGSAVNATSAFDQYKKACEAEAWWACENLGLLYQAGKGAPQDIAMAVTYFTKACEGGNGDGCASLGTLVRDGTGVPRDEVKALVLFEKACEMHSGFGCNRAGQSHKKNGDLTRARTFFQASCDTNFAAGCVNLADLAGQAVPGQ